MAAAVVCVFLRGGLDALSAAPPLAEGRYRDLRPTIAVPAEAALTLDDRFGLHPALAPLHELYRAGSLAVVHAVGNGTDSRSHFDAQAAVEAAGARPGEGGWLGRHLAVTAAERDEPGGPVVRGVGFGAGLTRALAGADHAVAMTSLASFGLTALGPARQRREAALAGLYAPDTALGAAGRQTLAALDELAGAVGSPSPAAAAVPPGPFADAAALLGAGLGVEAICIDLGGWDMHQDIGRHDAPEGTLRRRLAELAEGLVGFWRALPDARRQEVTVVVLSEFGRRAAENGSGGADHGAGGLLLVLGEGLAGGGRVFADWPGLGDAQLVRGDLRGTIDYRDVLAEVVAHRLGDPHLDRVLPGHTPKPLGVA